MSANVYLNIDPSERADADSYGLCLHAVRLEGEQDGYAVPVVTAAEFGRFISAWARNDPNGTWRAAGVLEGDGALVYDDGENDRDMWSVVGIDVDGAPLYALDGWTWEL